MKSIFSKFFASIRGGSDDRPRVRALLAQGERERATVEIVRIAKRSGNRQKPIVASIAKVGDEEFNVLCTAGHKMARDDAVEVCIYGPNGRTVFQSTVLGACRIAGGGDEQQSGGYRLSIPQQLKVINHRKRFRVEFDVTARIDVTLRSKNGSQQFRGVLRDLSVSGARVEVDGGASLREGARLIMVATLPEPGGPLAEPIRVVRAQRYRSGRTMVGLAFDKEVKSLAPFISRMQVRQASQAKRAKSA